MRNKTVQWKSSFKQSNWTDLIFIYCEQSIWNRKKGADTSQRQGQSEDEHLRQNVQN